MILIIGSLFGLISVAFGAYAEHGLRARVSTEDFRFLMTAIRYNQIHAVMISAIGLTLLSSTQLSKVFLLQASSWFFIAGVILFSFSIYLSVSFGLPSLLKITPVGGITIMLAWLLLLIAPFFVSKAASVL